MATNKTEINSKLLISVIVIMFLSIGLNIFFFASRKPDAKLRANLKKNQAKIDSLNSIYTNLYFQKKDTTRDTVEIPKLKIIYDEIEKTYPDPNLIEPDSVVKLWTKLSRQR